jgi:catechol 2,3-dioxygenase-like lactoylglutathione lyase family enzyme
MTTPKAGWSTPLLHVADVERSIRFYQLLGFELVDTQGEPPGWARLHCEGASIMFLQAEEPLDPKRAITPLYMYTPDLPAFRDHLLANGVDVPPIQRPEHMKSGEITVKDPDGQLVFVGHWGTAEHEAWKQHLVEWKAKRP